MRLLALVSDGFGATGDIARYNRDLIAALAQSPRISEVAVLPRFGAEAAAVPAKARQLPPCPGRVSWSVRALALAAERRFDAVFCGYLHAVPLAAAVAGLRRVPLWVQVHGTEAWQPPGTVHRLSLSAAALVTSASRYTRTRLLAWADVAPHRVRVLPNPSTGEGFGVMHLEAAASGLAVIAGNADGSVDALADGRIGRLIDPLEMAEIEAAAIEALEGRHPAPQAAEEARRFAFPRFAAHVDALVASLAR